MEVFTLAALAALVTKITSSIKYIKAGQLGDFVSQAVTWGVGIGLAFLAANANAMESVDLNGHTLGSLNGSSVVLVGLGLASLASVAYDFRVARDNNDSASEPSLVGP